MAEDASTDTASARLRALDAYFREHPVTSAEGHSYSRFGSRTTVTSPGLPFNVRVADHIQAHVDEVVAHTRTVNPDAGPCPDRVDAVYDWAREHTQHAPEAEQTRRDMREYRHLLEHAIAAGDTAVVRRHRCPDCRTFGLFWQGELGKAMCVNRHCAQGNNGVHRTHSLGRLAFEYTAAKRILETRAT